MNTRAFPPSYWAAIAAFVVAIPAAHAQTAPSDFTDEPDKTMAAAHESFVNGDKNKAVEEIRKASASVKKEAGEVAKGAKAGITKAGEELDKLGRGIEKGAVKSGDELKKTFARVDHALATAWHKTAAETQKAGKDPSAALKRAGAGLEGVAKWSGTKLKEGAQAGVDGVKKIGEGAKLGADEIGKFFKGIGDGIKDLGHHLKAAK